MGGRQTLKRLVTWGLAIVLVVSIVAVVAIAADPPGTSDPYTEFYLLGSDGNASEYPTALSTGESGDLIVGISNQEQQDTTYTLQVTWNGTTTQEQTFDVASAETVEEELSIVAPEDPGRYRVRFELFQGDMSDEPYRSTRLLVTVEQ